MEVWGRKSSKWKLCTPDLEIGRKLGRALWLIEELNSITRNSLDPKKGVSQKTKVLTQEMREL